MSRVTQAVILTLLWFATMGAILSPHLNNVSQTYDVVALSAVVWAIGMVGLLSGCK